MTDRELLELAAKAAGLQVVWHEPDDDSEPWCFIPDCHPPHNRRQRDKESGVIWNPLTDDGDALRLAVTCGLVVDCSRPSAGEPYKQHTIWLDETMSNAELTRRAIVRAAAEIGRSKG